MADVGDGRGILDRRLGAGQGDDTPDRAQIMLVTALSLAILFVALALILNTAIYTENLATRSSDIGGGTDAVRYHDAARDGVGGIVEYANYNNNTSHGDLQTALRNGTADFRNFSARQFAIGDRAAETTLDSTVNGTRVVQTDESRDFSDASGTTDWTVATDVNNARSVRMNVSQDNLVDLGLSPFELILDDGTNQWTMTVSSTASTEITVTVDGPTASGDCTEPVANAWINVSEGTLAGEPCDVLDSFADGLTTPYEISIANGDEISGTYTMIVDNSTIADNVGSNPSLNSPGSGQPFATHAIYSTNATVIYETSRLRYESTIRIAPGEEGDD